MAKYWTDDEGLQNMKKFCVEQERCQEEIRKKLIDHQIYGERTEGIIADLILEDYLNEERFACAYVRGKFRMNQWGKQMILQGLKSKKISDYCIKKAFKSEIGEKEYLVALETLLAKKLKTLKKENKYQAKQKLVSFAMGKGYSSNDINIVLEDMNL
jgi:regulatory protein